MSTVNRSSSSTSSVSPSALGERKRKREDNREEDEGREIQRRAKWWKEILKSSSGNSSSESPSGHIIGGSEPFETTTIPPVVSSAATSTSHADMSTINTMPTATTHNAAGTACPRESSDVAAPTTTTNILSLPVLYSDSSSSSAVSVGSRKKKTHPPNLSTSATPTTNTPSSATRGKFKIPVGVAPSTRTPSSARSSINTPLSGFSRTPGSSRTRTPGTNSSTTPGSSRSRTTRTPGSGRPRTPGSAVSRTSHTTQDLPPSTIVGVVEGRGQARGEVGMAAIDLRCPQLTLTQFSDTHTYTHTLTKLAILNPLEVVVATTAVRPDSDGTRGAGVVAGGEVGGGLLRVVQECAPEVPVTAVHRRYFNDNRGLAVVKHLAAPHCAYIARQVANRYYCLAAAAAVMKYVEHVQHVTYAPHSLHIMLTSSENTLAIDYWSCRKLEVVSNLRGGWQDSLLGALRHTRTHPGTRKLRASLLQPMSETSTINARLDAIQYLAENCELFYTLQSILGRFPDIDWILSMCVQVPKEAISFMKLVTETHVTSNPHTVTHTSIMTSMNILYVQYVTFSPSGYRAAM
ncbi:hypothetical protein Pcinc_018636 [Petrolisthes cinctipes]|uniref:DNA mismatch repair protein MutS core domain-containing protein n=1 Tax=Petrolisthes cinctipes TaxID=88211 RepID=A0AAE1FLS2_PETCI|nr:hypothetical protein Pcinc_018636 [Petrolisthes cinctipes]